MECTCVVSAEAMPSLSCRPLVFRNRATPGAQVFARFWHELAARCELVLGGAD